MKKVFLAIPCGDFTHSKRTLVFKTKKEAKAFCKLSEIKNEKDWSIDGWYCFQYATVRGGD